MKTPHHVVWLRQDLRSIDNTALVAACENPEAIVSALYIATPKQWLTHDVAGVRIDFEHRHLQTLHLSFATLGIQLVVLQCDNYAAIPALLCRWLQQHGVSALFANKQYELNEQARDQHVSSALANIGVASHWFDDLCIIPPGHVVKADGDYYTVFTPFKRNWLSIIEQHGIHVMPAPVPRKNRINAMLWSPWTYPASHVPESVSQHLWPVGEEAAQQRLLQFLDDDGAHYKDQRDLAAENGTSTLSPYLAAGVISARQGLQQARLRRLHANPQNSIGFDTWISELCWRDFYKHILVGFPHVCRHQAFKRETDQLQWRHDDALFSAWCEGRTGFPIVDAAMKQLQQTGWMHNRLRMITAMFLTKDLFIDWRLGEQFFMRHLIDGDLSANNGGWQWSASTGNDAAPYFRIFNPVLQSQKCDPDGRFIRQFLPELSALDNKQIHEPYAKGNAAVGLRYPRPIVDHNEARQHTLASFKALSLL
ncbi:MAG: deoxyribodipyrimidine photo-lyase [Moraxellaceae bacterium]|nr:deoxyribodipyrimidine photo-lyase [Moraxellaceae bacterium]MDP1776359.1 deoxyribodipyrimidine photo-lyase [Moraxellaceae bacterium]